ncbi:MAG: hypothetical protein JRJ85_10305 [Deltaproteobacteria bacterium]|nr:hypothetical protein [Deltaproteobacteria bacterium]
MTIHQASWLKAMDGLGVPAHRAASEQGLEEILSSWDLSQGPLFIETRFDPEKYQDMVRGLR